MRQFVVNSSITRHRCNVCARLSFLTLDNL